MQRVILWRQGRRENAARAIAYFVQKGCVAVPGRPCTGDRQAPPVRKTKASDIYGIGGSMLAPAAVTRSAYPTTRIASEMIDPHYGDAEIFLGGRLNDLLLPQE